MNKKIWYASFEMLILVLVAALMIFPQWHRQGIILGNDLVFHYNRFYDTYMHLDYSPRYLGHEIASGRSESNVWSVANTD